MIIEDNLNIFDHSRTEDVISDIYDGDTYI